MTALTVGLGQPESYPEYVASNVRAEAGRRGVNQLELAQAIGLAQPAMSLRWWGRREFKLSDLEKIARALDVNTDTFTAGYASRDLNPEPAD